MKISGIKQAAIKAALLMQPIFGNFGNRDMRPKEFFDPQEIQGSKFRGGKSGKTPKGVRPNKGSKKHRRGFLCVRPAWR